MGDKRNSCRRHGVLSDVVIALCQSAERLGNPTNESAMRARLNSLNDRLSRGESISTALTEIVLTNSDKAEDPHAAKLERRIQKLKDELRQYRKG